jgi:hypothetical protein
VRNTEALQSKILFSMATYLEGTNTPQQDLSKELFIVTGR